jgi:hypothetical protein
MHPSIAAPTWIPEDGLAAGRCSRDVLTADRFIEQGMAGMIAMWINHWVTSRPLVKPSGVPEPDCDSTRSRWLDVSAWGA